VTDQDDPYLKCIINEKDPKEICKVAEFYCKRLMRMVGHRAMIGEVSVSQKENVNQADNTENIQRLSLTTLLVKVQSIMDSITNNQEILI
jgi:hypothetical protein